MDINWIFSNYIYITSKVLVNELLNMQNYAQYAAISISYS